MRQIMLGLSAFALIPLPAAAQTAAPTVPKMMTTSCTFATMAATARFHSTRLAE